MNIITVGLNHKTAPVAIREKLSFPEDAIGAALKRLTAVYGLTEGLIISTCNRVEVVAVSPNVDRGIEDIKRFLAESHKIPLSELNEHLYDYSGEEAVKHLFRVSAGLDSMVMGEPQILGQVKDAYGHAVQHSTAGVIITKLSHKAFSVAKRIRTETKIGAAAVSISYAAVELAKKIFGDIRDKSVMLIGAGEMAELAARHLQNAGIRELLIANRTYERAVNMAKAFDARAIMYREFVHCLKDVDIVIASTGSPKFIVGPDDLTEVMKERKNSPMFFIDIAVPRNVDPLVNNIDNIYAYDVDDLQGVIQANLKERQKEAKEAEAIVAEEIGTFYCWVKSLDVVPTIIALRKSLDTIRKTELEKALSELGELTDKDKKTLESMTSAIVNKILHAPVTHLKKEANNIEGDFYIEAARRLFDLEDEKEDEETTKAAGGESA
jgi:glutamyl-tRNA reductase